MFKNSIVQFVTNRKYRWLRHTLLIAIGVLLAFKGDVGGARKYPDEETWKAIMLADLIVFCFIMVIIYLLLQYFVPVYLFRSKVLAFFVIFVVSVVLIFFAVYLVDRYILMPANPENLNHITLDFLTFMQINAVTSVLLGSVVGMKVFKKWIVDVQQMNELRERNLHAELEQLKSQVNPHFLFNTLNNLVVLTKTAPEKAIQVLLGLSDLLRYQLYDSTKREVLLEKDIEFIRNLLELEKIRKDDFEYTILTEGNLEGKMVPPFLLIPFIENAIKHGASTVGHSYLNISIRAFNNKLNFEADNSKPLVKSSMKGGIGLSNIQRRLELLYPNRYILEITDEPSRYIINLTIPL